MTRTRFALTLTTLSLAGLLGLSGCAAGAAPADTTAEAAALRSVGLDTGLAAAPAPSASASDSASDSASASAKAPHERRAGVRRYLRKNTLHGQITVQGKAGPRTIVVQRGTVTAVTATGLTVQSADGFTGSWTFGAKLRVVQNKKAVAVGTLKTGAEVGVAGSTEGSANAARLIVVS